MSKSKGSTVNIGLRSIYNFHIGNDINKKVNMEIAKEWFPENTIQQEYYILKRIKELADNKDGKRIELKSYASIASLYMTYDTPDYKDGDGVVRYSNKREYLIESVNRAEKRFEDLKSKGLVSGRYASPEITLSGIQKLETQIDNFDEINKSLQELISVAKDLCANEKDVLYRLNEIFKNASKKTSVRDWIDSLNTTVNFIGNIAKIANVAPKIKPSLALFLSLVKNALSK